MVGSFGLWKFVTKTDNSIKQDIQWWWDSQTVLKEKNTPHFKHRSFLGLNLRSWVYSMWKRLKHFTSRTVMTKTRITGQHIRGGIKKANWNWKSPCTLKPPRSISSSIFFKRVVTLKYQTDMTKFCFTLLFLTQIHCIQITIVKF